jgi:opacity protein-like surface antigen
MIKLACMFLAAGLALAPAAPLAASARAVAATPKAHGKGAGLLAPPIEPVKPRDEKPRAGWGGFYGGLNAGAGFSDKETRQ